MRLDDIPFEETRWPEPPAPPLADLFATGPARAAAWRHWVTDAATGAGRVGLYGIFSLLPLDAASAMGAGIAPVFRWMNRKTLAQARMERALARIRPDLDTPDKRRPVIDDWWRNTVRTLAEFPSVDALAEPTRLVHEGREHIEAALASGRPVIVVSVHLASWEASFRVLIAASREAGKPWFGVYAPQRNRFENRLVYRTRRRSRTYAFPPAPGTVRRLFQLLKSGAANFAILVDEPADGEVGFPLFGRRLPERCNLRIAMRLARRTNAVILPAYLSRPGGARLVAHWTKPMEIADHPPDEEGEQAFARALSPRFEEPILARPSQWYMLDRLKFR